ncbi:MAG: SLAC1 anion channel family protein [Pseudomonadota bacterium]
MENQAHTPTAAQAAPHGRLEHMPIAMFAIVMGLAGLTIATEKAETLWGWGLQPSLILLAVTALVFGAISAAYLTKLIRHRKHVMEEYNHPIRLSFFPAIPIGLILLAIASLNHFPTLALGLWAVGSAVQLLFTLMILSAWIHHEKFQIQHSNPAWFIPIVGNILVPVAGAPLGFPEVSWFFFSIGLVFWVVLLTILMNRFFFHNPIPAKLLPTLFILIAPPAVGFISWIKLHNGVLDDAGRVLYYVALFTTLLLFFQFKQFAKVKFALPWWAYSFPMAAITIASMIMLEKLGGAFFASLTPILYTLLVLLIVVLVFNTIRAMMRGEICVPE